MKTLLFILILLSSSMADDIYFKRGQIIKNVKIIEETAFDIVIQTTNNQHKLRKETILRIVEKPFDPNIETEVIKASEDFTLSDSDKPPTIKKEFPNLILLPVSVLSFLLSWDYFSQASDIQNTIDVFKDLGGDTDELESTKTRKTIIGVGCAAIGVVSAIIAFTPKEIRISSNQISLNYHF